MINSFLEEWIISYIIPLAVLILAVFNAVRKQQRWGNSILKVLKQLQLHKYEGLSSISIKKMAEEAKAILSCLKIIWGVANTSSVVHVGYFVIHNGETDVLQRHIWKASMRHELGTISMIDANQNVNLLHFLKPLIEIEKKGYSIQNETTKIPKLKLAIKSKHFKDITYFGIIINGVPTFIISVATLEQLKHEQIQAIQKQVSILYAYFLNELDTNTRNLLEDDTD
jgi:hypothetical protein